VFMRCSAWRHLAEHIGDTCCRGMRVIASGRLSQREYEDRDGIKRTIMELNVEEIGPSLKYVTAKVNKAARSGPAGGQPPHPGDEWQNGGQGGGWGQGEPAGVAAGGWGNADESDRPF
jgi:single-strand DNA-binding protein